jgi:hypothetical protein
MKKHLLVAGIALIWLSCTKYNDYKKYITQGENTYPGKPDSLVVYPGHNRVLVNFLIQSDPSIIGARIYWNTNADSTSLAIKVTGTVDTIRTYIDSLAEGTYNFQVQTFDIKGNFSVPAYYTCNVYGNNYLATLLNIGYTTAIVIPPGNGFVVFGPLDFEDGLVGVRATWTDTNGNLEDTTAQLSQTQPFVQFPNCTDGTTLNYAALYLPEAASIDTFATSNQSITLP